MTAADLPQLQHRSLFVDYIPPKYYVRNPDITRTSGLYENLVDQEKSAVWPVRPTLGVNRGYRPEVPRPDGSAYYYQGVSSPLIYRGTPCPGAVWQRLCGRQPHQPGAPGQGQCQ
jgi:hypothetical protein